MNKILVLNSLFLTDLYAAHSYNRWSHGCKALQVKEGDEVVIRLTKASPLSGTGSILVGTIASSFYNSDTPEGIWMFNKEYPSRVKLKDTRVILDVNYEHYDQLKKTRANMSGLAYMEV